MEAIDVYDTPEYKAYEDRVIAESRNWHEQWPDACTHCLGQGAFHDHGSFYEPPSTDPCEHCTAESKCARCGKVGLNEDGEGPCSFCNWNYDDYDPICQLG